MTTFEALAKINALRGTDSIDKFVATFAEAIRVILMNFEAQHGHYGDASILDLVQANMHASMRSWHIQVITGGIFTRVLEELSNA